MKDNKNTKHSAPDESIPVSQDTTPEDELDLSEDDIPEYDEDDDFPEDDPAEDGAADFYPDGDDSEADEGHFFSEHDDSADAVLSSHHAPKEPLHIPAGRYKDVPVSARAGEEDRTFGDSPETDAARAAAAHVQRRTLRSVIVNLQLIAVFLILLYAGGCVYFAGHFTPGTVLNGTDVSFCSAAKASERLETSAADYTLTVHGRDNVDDTIRGSEISYSISCDEDLTQQLHESSFLKWPLNCFRSRELSVSCSGSYDEAQLKTRVSSLAFFQDGNIRQPGNAVCSFVEESDSYQVIAGDPGTVPSSDNILQTISSALSDSLSEVTLGDDCYEEAVLTEDDPDLVETASLLNQILDMTVTLSFGDQEEVLPRDQLKSFISVPDQTTSDDELTADSEDTSTDSADSAAEDSQSSLSEEEQLQAEMESRLSRISFQDDAIASYVASLAETYDTYGKDREFKTHSGDTVTVSGGSYGWQMDQEGTVTALKAFLTAAESGSFDPVWTKEAASFGDIDIGTTYAEVNLDEQKVYLYVDGDCILETDCVSGKAIDSDRATPTGTYSIDYRKSPAVLKGADYESPVTYWMPFNRGVGFHDASWRSKFGGEIYLTNGSHGCINLPTSAAETLYENVYSGMPVVVYGGMTPEEAQEYTGKNPDPPVTVKESESDIGGGADDSSADSTGSAAAADTSAQDAAAAQQAQTAVLQQAIQNYIDQGMSAEAAQAQVQADLAAQYAAQQAAAAGQ